MVKYVGIVCVMVALVCSGADERPSVRWRGFNLLGMFINHGQTPHFEEEDFKLISELGFNFVRLPMDYRFWIKDKDWTVIDDERLVPVDQAVAYGKKYGLHVCSAPIARRVTRGRRRNPRSLHRSRSATGLFDALGDGGATKAFLQ